MWGGGGRGRRRRVKRDEPTSAMKWRDGMAELAKSTCLYINLL